MPDPLEFAKYQALGNDFIVGDARAEPGLVDNEALARGLLDRHRGIGADDLIFLTTSARADVGMRIRSPFGGWLSMCGNGIRCLAGYLADERRHASDLLRIETDVGIRETRLLGGPERTIEVDLLTPDLRA